jgi:predicted GTPase
MTGPVIAVFDARSPNGLGPTAARVQAVLPDAAVVPCADGLAPVPAPDVVIRVVDPLVPESAADLGRADIVVLDDVRTAPKEAVAAALSALRAANERAVVIQATSAPRLEPGPSLMDTAVLVVEDGATVTDGRTPVGAGTLAAVGAEVGMRVDPRPYAVGPLVETYRTYPQLGAVLPVMAYDAGTLAAVAATVDAVACDAVVDGTAIDLAGAIRIRHPVRRVVRDLREVSAPTLAEALRLFTHGDSVSAPMPAPARRRKLVAGKEGEPS